MYRVSSRHKTRAQRLRRRLFIVFLLLVSVVALAVWYVLTHRPKPVIHQAKAVVTKVSYVGKTKLYNEGDFSIEIPVGWQVIPRPPNTYQSFTWHNIDKTNGMQIEIYEDTIPYNFAVNRALIISPEKDHVEIVGPASENCVNFTKDVNGGPNDRAELGVRAKWQNIDFLCNRNTIDRDVIGTSSRDGINVVKLRSSNGSPHSFFFTYSDNQLNPDYSIFYNAVTSFNMN